MVQGAMVQIMVWSDERPLSTPMMMFDDDNEDDDNGDNNVGKFWFC